MRAIVYKSHRSVFLVAARPDWLWGAVTPLPQRGRY